MDATHIPSPTVPLPPWIVLLPRGEVDDGGGVRSLCLGPNHRNHRARAQVLPWSVAAAADARADDPDDPLGDRDVAGDDPDGAAQGISEEAQGSPEDGPHEAADSAADRAADGAFFQGSRGPGTTLRGEVAP